MSTISIKNLTFGYDGSSENVFENLTLNLDTDWKLGLVGRNGKGKTTLLKLLNNEYKYSGVIHENTEFLYFPFTVSDENNLTEYIVEEIVPGYEPWEFQKELRLLDLDPDIIYSPFCTLSGGEQTKVMLAALFLRSGYFLLIDEPTNHLDSLSRKKVGEYLASKKGFILVSHDRELLNSCTDHILSINKTNTEIIAGNYLTYESYRNNKESFETTQNEKLKTQIDKLSASAKRTSKWADNAESNKRGVQKNGVRADTGFLGHKAAKVQQRAISMQNRKEKAVEEKKELLKDIDMNENLKIFPLVPPQKRMVELKNVSVFYEDKKICDNINFTINHGDRLCISGKNGCGKSSLLKLIAGAHIKYTGELYIQNNLKISYVSQDTSDLRGPLKDFCQSRSIDESLFKSILRKMDFSREQFSYNIEDFSGGQKKKVLIAASLCEQSHLYIFDEPLNFIDLLSREQIENLILNNNPTMLFVEHDMTFCSKITTNVFNILTC